MANASDQKDYARPVGNNPLGRRPAARGPVGFLGRMIAVVLEWGESGDDAEVASFLIRSGGRLTDDIEREMMRRRTISNWSVHA
jgi:hypothetical protein